VQDSARLRPQGAGADIEDGRVDVVVVYKIDRLTRSLMDFAKLVEVFDRKGVTFVSITQSFNTTTSMGRLTLNMLLSFAQFEREVTGERIRDKIAASKKKGMWIGGFVPIGYEAKNRTLTIIESEAETVRLVFRLYLELKNVRLVEEELRCRGVTTKRYVAASGRTVGGQPFSRGHIYKLLSNPLYIGEIAHKGTRYPGQHPAIIDADTWQAVQAQLKENTRGNRTQGKCQGAEPALGAAVRQEGQSSHRHPCREVRPAVPVLCRGERFGRVSHLGRRDRAGRHRPGCCVPRPDRRGAGRAGRRAAGA
jgi:site-specific DNA recombinase